MKKIPAPEQNTEITNNNLSQSSQIIINTSFNQPVNAEFKDDRDTLKASIRKNANEQIFNQNRSSCTPQKKRRLSFDATDTQMAGKLNFENIQII